MGLSGTSTTLPSPTLPSCDAGLTGAAPLSTPTSSSLTPTDLGLSIGGGATGVSTTGADTGASGDEGFDGCHLPEITFSTALAWAMRVADQIWPPGEAGAGPTGDAAGAASLLGPQTFPGPDLAGTTTGAGANDVGDGAGRRGAAGSKGVRSSSSKWRPMRDGVVRKDGIAAAAAAAAVGEGTGTRGRATAAATGDADVTGRSAGRGVTPGAEGSGSSDGIEPPWKSLSVIVVTVFFFDMAAPGAVAVELRRRRKMSGCSCCFRRA